MNYYFAPMEGVTTWIYRRAFNKYFGSFNAYFTPFIAPNQNNAMNSQERNEILPEHNLGLRLIPQILTNRSDYFLSTAKELKSYGYQQVNLNLGCPSGTVVAKGRGAGFLSRKDELRIFLDEVFSMSDLQISIKTRVGHYTEDEWPELLNIFNTYPCYELIIHPRIQKDYYKYKPRMKSFELAFYNHTSPLVYNGDLFSYTDIQKILMQFPNIQGVMVGRGAICNPWILTGSPDLLKLKAFHDEILDDYRSVMYGDGQVLCKMKGIWTYLIQAFTNYEQYQKVIRKTRSLSEYQSTVNSLFHNEAYIPNTIYQPEK